MLPKNLKFQSKIESASAKSYKSNVSPMNGTGDYGVNSNIIINIPTRANLCLAGSESFLKFDVVFKNGATSANNIRLDSCGGHSFISRLRLFHGSNLLEDIQEYNLLAKMLFDLQIPTDGAYGKYNILAGTRSDLVPNIPLIASPSGTDATTTQTLANEIKTSLNASKSVLQINSGELVGSSLSANALTTKRTYCLNLISLLGSLSPVYIPLFACTSAPLRLELQLVSSTLNCCASLTAVDSFTISNCEFIAQMIELSDVAMGMIASSLGGQPLQFVIPSYRNYQYTGVMSSNSASNSDNTTQTQLQFAIPAKFSSLRSLFCTIRDKQTGELGFFPYSSVTAGIQDYTFRVGSVIMPAKAPNNLIEMFSEVLKAIGSMSDINHHPSIELASYSLPLSVAHTAVGNTNSGSFYIGLDMENYANSSDYKNNVFAGFNSNSDDIFLIANFIYPAKTAGATALNYSVRLDSFAMFDQVVIFENSTAFVRF